MRRGSNRRQFQWVRTSGTIELVEPDPAVSGVGAFGAVDLLGPARTQYGQLLDAGATVMSIKGYAKPNFRSPSVDGVFLTGAMAIRKCSRSDVQFPRADDAPTAAISEDEPFMWFNPFLFNARAAEEVQNDGNFADSSVGTRWAVNVRSHRKLPQLTQTLGMFASTFGSYSQAGVGSIPIDYFLSIGVKLP